MALVASLGCGDRSARPDDATGAAATAGSTPAGESLASIPMTEIRLLFPGPDDDLLHAQTRSVVSISAPEERATQCLEELFRGPGPGLLPVAPDGTRVQQIYLLPDGTVYVDLSSDILKLQGGSTRELQTVYAIVDTLALNVPGIKRIGILVDGEPRETLGGHVCTLSPLLADFSYADEFVGMGGAGAAEGTPPAMVTPGGAAAPGAEGKAEGKAAGKAEGEKKEDAPPEAPPEPPPPKEPQ